MIVFFLSFIILILLLLSTPIKAQNGLALLKIASGARLAGMGEATVAVPDNLPGLSYNPAAISKLIKYTFIQKG